MTFSEVQLPSRPSKTRLSDEAVKAAVRLIKAGKTASPDSTYKSRASAQSAAHALRHQLAERSDLSAKSMRSVTYQNEGEEAWRVAVAPRAAK